MLKPPANEPYAGANRLAVLAIVAAACSLCFLLIALGGNYLYLDIPTADYLVFHQITEFASIIVSFAIFTVGWYGYKQQASARSLVLALTFFAVGSIDFIHTLSYEGMPEFLSINSLNKAAFYWISARAVSAIGLLAVVLIPSRSRALRNLHPALLLAATAGAVLFAVLLTSLAPETVPPLYIEGEGLTPYKNGLEYMIIVIYALIILQLWRRPVFGSRPSLLLQAGLLVAIFSEFAFTLYATAFDTYNLLGHIFKIVSYYLFLRAIFVSSLQQPYSQLRRASADLERSFNSIGLALSSSLELDKILKLIADLASDVLRSPHAMVALQEKDPDSLSVMATRGVEIDPPVIPLNHSLAGKIWQERKPVCITDLDTAPVMVPPRIPGGEIHSAVAAPILTDSSILGVISVYSPQVGFFDEDDARLLAAFARHAAAAIENAHLYENQMAARSKILNYTTQLSILHNIGLSLNRQTDQKKLLEQILEGAMGLTSAGVGTMCLLKDGQPELTSVHYAPWYKNRCQLGDSVPAMHHRLSGLIESDERDTVRVADLDDSRLDFRFPAGHIGLEGLLVGIIRGTKGQMRGYFALSAKAGNDHFKDEDEEIISLLAAQSSVALISAENFEREHTVAETLQATLLPEAPSREDLEVGLLYHSAGPHSKVGGDFYDFVELESGKIAIAVGDVCGKGLEAATYTAMIKYMLRAYLEEGMYPGDCLTRLNRAIHRQVSVEKFVTMGLAVIDTLKRTLVYSSAGHPPPIICSAGKASPLYVPQALPLGVLHDRTYLSTQSVLVEPSSTLVMYTDGLMEARPPEGEPLGVERLTRKLATHCTQGAQQLADSLLKLANDYADGNLRDDIALLVVKLKC